MGGGLAPCALAGPAAICINPNTTPGSSICAQCSATHVAILQVRISTHEHMNQRTFSNLRALVDKIEETQQHPRQGGNACVFRQKELRCLRPVLVLHLLEARKRGSAEEESENSEGSGSEGELETYDGEEGELVVCESVAGEAELCVRCRVDLEKFGSREIREQFADDRFLLGKCVKRD